MLKTYLTAVMIMTANLTQWNFWWIWTSLDKILIMKLMLLVKEKEDE